MRPRFLSVCLALCALASPAFGQSSPNLSRGQVPTAAQWNSYFAMKQDVLGFTPLNKGGDTILGRLAVSSLLINQFAAFNIAPGGVPSAPVDGDMWMTLSGLFMQVSGVTVGPLYGSYGPPTAGNTVIANATSGLAQPLPFAMPSCSSATSALQWTTDAGFACGSTFVTSDNTVTLTNKTIDTAGPNTIKINGNTLSASAGTATVTVPNATDTLVGRATSDTLTNKTIDGSQLVAGSTANSKLSNSAAYTLKGNFTGSSAAPQDSTIAALTQQTTPSASDLLLLADQSTGQLKKVLLSAVSTSGGTTQTSTCSSPITVAATDVVIIVNAAAACTINLPAAASKTVAVTIFDNNGTAATNQWTIVPNGAELIGGQASVTFAAAYGSIRLSPITSGYSPSVSAPLNLSNHRLMVGRGNGLLPVTIGDACQTAGYAFITTASGDPTCSQTPLLNGLYLTAVSAPSTPPSGQAAFWIDSGTKIGRTLYSDGTTFSYMALNVTCGVGLFVSDFTAGTYTCSSPATPIAFGSCGATIAANTTAYITPSNCTQTTADVGGFAATSNGTLSRLRVKSGGSPGGSDTFVMTVMVAGVASSITCTVTSAVSVCNDTTHTASVTAGQIVDVRVVTSATANARLHGASVEFAK